MGDVFTQLSLVIVVAAGVAMIMRLLKQPLIMGHILTGILVGPSLLGLIDDRHAFETFSEIGIALLLFIIGLELSMATIKRLGKPVFATAAAILLTVGTIGYLFGVALHFSLIESLVLGLGLFFSSTIIIAKMLSDKKELTRLNGQIAVGVILLDDVVATFALLFIAAGSGNEALNAVTIGILLLKGVAVVTAIALVATKVLPSLMKKIAQSQEMLFLFALAWGFGVATLFNYAGFSIEIGALFAGVALAHLPYTHQIGARLKPLRDFFIILFFISLGEGLELGNLAAVAVPAVMLSIIVLVLKPIVVMSSLGLLGYTRRTSFKTGINLSQISEFSIILVVLANQAGMVGDKMAALITLIAIITIAVSTYLMQYDDTIFAKIGHKLNMFERATVSESKHHAKEYPLILFGYKNGGQQFLKTFRSMKQRYVVIDYDPDVIEELERKRIDYLYGDATDPELLTDINVEKAQLIVNTIGDHAVNTSLVRYVRKRTKDAIIICYSAKHQEAEELYKLGANYVMLPHFIGSERLSMYLHLHGVSKESFDEYRKKQLVDIGKIALKKK